MACKLTDGKYNYFLVKQISLDTVLVQRDFGTHLGLVRERNSWEFTEVVDK